MDPLFTKEQLNNMKREYLIQVTLLMQEQKRKNENEIQLLNWLFAKNIHGADASAIVYSIVETALLNGLKPYLYLMYVLERLCQLGPFPKQEDLDSLLPWSEDLQKISGQKLNRKNKDLSRPEGRLFLVKVRMITYLLMFSGTSTTCWHGRESSEICSRQALRIRRKR